MFTIADDLTKMQVQASVDEADIGQVHVGQTATFTVDAYPDRTFNGAVSQIRLQPTISQNVVTYTVMIDLENADMKLMPGMTANITIPVQQVAGILKVPSAALKFAPPSMPENTRPKGQRSFSRDSAKDGAINGSPRHNRNFTDPSSQKRPSRVFILDNGKLRFVKVTTGLTSNGFTQVDGDLHEGEQVVLSVLTKQNNKPSSAVPFQPAAPGMGGGMRRF